MGTERDTGAGAPRRGVRAVDTDDERLRAFRQAFANHVGLPTGASVIDEPVTVVEVAYDGNTRRGLTARCRTGHGREHVVALADGRFPEGSEAAHHVAKHRAWLGLEITTDASNPMPHGRARPAASDADIDLSRPVELVVLSVKERAARCRLLGTDATITLRSRGLWAAVPGEMVTVHSHKHWRYAGHPYLSGDIASTRLDVAALELSLSASSRAGRGIPRTSTGARRATPSTTGPGASSARPEARVRDGAGAAGQ